ncbi:MAG TPA: SPOR domain-containing protein [Blastocatellia bacterium]|nr:SPOR domain-containing protein [Blastocatellia bacterium]
MLFGLAGAQSATYTVQFKASPNREEADEEIRQLKAKNISAYIVKSVVPGKGVFYRVRAGVFSNQSDAKRFGANLQQRGLVSDFFVTNYEKPVDDVASGSAPSGPPQTKATARANQPSPNSASGDTRPAVQKRTESAPLKSDPGEAPSPASPVASRSATVARNNPPANPASNSPTRSTPTPANNPGLSASVGEAPAATPPSGFQRFRDPKIGYSFDYPDYWIGQPLSDKEANEQRMNAGAMFSSQKDSAFLSVIWNELDKANNLANENDLIVDVILRSMSASDGISKLEETARRVENRGGLIKTYLELKAVLQTPEQTAPLDFLGKAVIVRASRGILLVATFYAKDSAPNVAASIDKIIASARPPQ